MSCYLGWSRDYRFYRYIGVNVTFGLLDCDSYIGNIVKPWIVSFVPYILLQNWPGWKMLIIIYREYRYIEERYIGVPLQHGFINRAVFIPAQSRRTKDYRKQCFKRSAEYYV